MHRVPSASGVGEQALDVRLPPPVSVGKSCRWSPAGCAGLDQKDGIDQRPTAENAAGLQWNVE